MTKVSELDFEEVVLEHKSLDVLRLNRGKKMVSIFKNAGRQLP